MSVAFRTSRWTAIVAAIAICLAAPTAANADPGDIVVFDDPNLKACVADALEVAATSDITEAQMATLTELVCQSESIVTITPLQYATNLTQLWLTSNEIVDVSALSSLTDLQVLHLGTNRIVDVSPLAGLPNLELLNLTDNEVADISPLTGMASLTTLLAGLNQIVDASVMSGTPNLDTLFVGENDITGLSLVNLPNLTELRAAGNEISEISFTGAPGLRYLELSNNQISDLSAVAGLTSLESLYAAENHLRDISPAGNLPNLMHWWLVDQEIAVGPAYAGVPTDIPEVLDFNGAPLQVTVAIGSGTIAGNTVTWTDPTDPSVLAWSTGATAYSGALVYSPVLAGEAPSIDEAASNLPTGVVGSEYAGMIAMSGVPAPTVELTGDDLPAGLSLSADGVLSGVPVVAGSFSFEVTASNGVDPDAVAE
ncbi:MAG: leucine-rich repeat domain-containing protein, partial [Beutenbergiaceae bacterium]